MRSSIDLDHDANVADATALRRMLEAIDSCPAPVVAQVQGHALGGGVGLVACSDIAIAHERAVFAFSEVKLGIIPAVISPFALAKIGPSAARRYFVTGERFDAEEALRIGLVHEVVSDLDAALDRVLAELRSAGPRAARAAKRLVLERPDGAGDSATHRRAADERGRPGRSARVPRAPPAGLDASRRRRVVEAQRPPKADAFRGLRVADRDEADPRLRGSSGAGLDSHQEDDDEEQRDQDAREQDQRLHTREQLRLRPLGRDAAAGCAELA